MPRLLIVAGVNGAGKSTLYNQLEKSTDLGIKINADEIAKKIGDFNDRDIQFRAGKEAINLINGCINSKTNFNFESTLSGRGIFNKIKYAKSNGFEVDIIYIAIDKKTSKLRINSRVLKGGHNISNEDVERRYDKSISNFINNINIFDNVYFYENEESKHNLIFFIESGRLKYLKNSIPEWIEIKFDLKNMLDKFKNE